MFLNDLTRNCLVLSPLFPPRPFADPFIFFCSFNVPQHLFLPPAFNAVFQSPSDSIQKLMSQLSWAPFLFLAIQFIYSSGSLEQSCILLHQHSREVISYSVSYSFWTHREAAIYEGAALSEILPIMWDTVVHQQSLLTSVSTSQDLFSSFESKFPLLWAITATPWVVLYPWLILTLIKTFVYSYFLPHQRKRRIIKIGIFSLIWACCLFFFFLCPRDKLCPIYPRQYYVLAIYAAFHLLFII